MKKLLLSTIVLLGFSIALVIFQISCTKTANSQNPSFTLTPATTSKLGGVIPDGTTIGVDATGKISTITNTSTVKQEGKLLYCLRGKDDTGYFFWTSNFDGSNPQKINIKVPAGLVIGNGFNLSPDHKTIFFEVGPISGNAYHTYFYSCNIDGSNSHQIIDAGADGGSLGVAF